LPIFDLEDGIGEIPSGLRLESVAQQVAVRFAFLEMLQPPLLGGHGITVFFLRSLQLLDLALEFRQRIGQIGRLLEGLELVEIAPPESGAVAAPAQAAI